jgi:hypothetical protein
MDGQGYTATPGRKLVRTGARIPVRVLPRVAKRAASS